MIRDLVQAIRVAVGNAKQQKIQDVSGYLWQRRFVIMQQAKQAAIIRKENKRIEEAAKAMRRARSREAERLAAIRSGLKKGRL